MSELQPDQVASARPGEVDGVVGTRRTFRQQGLSTDHIEFIAVGTAVVSKTDPGRLRRPDGAPFTSTSTSRTSTRCSEPVACPSSS